MKALAWVLARGRLTYLLLGLFSFVFFIFVTFPYETLQQRITMEAQAAGFSVRMSSLGPGFFGVTAHGVEVAKLNGGEGSPPEALKLDSVTLRPSLFPLGISASASAFGGKVHATYGGLSDTSVEVNLSNVNLASGNIKSVSGVDLAGVVTGELSLDIPATSISPSGKVKEPDLSQASGHLNLHLSKLEVRGGTVTVPLYGQMTPMDLPRLNIGDVELSMPFSKGEGKLEKLTGSGGDLDLLGSGTLKLARQVPYSNADLHFKLKPSPALMKNGFIGGGIAMLPADPTNPGFRAARMTGFLASPNFAPGT